MQQLFVYRKLQLLSSNVSKGGTMSRMNLSKRSYSNMLCSTENAYEYIFQHYGVKAHKDCKYYALQRTISIRQSIVLCLS